MCHAQKFSSIGIMCRNAFQSDVLSLNNILSYNQGKLPWIALMPHSADCRKDVGCQQSVPAAGNSPIFTFPNLKRNGHISSKKWSQLLQFHL